MQVLYIIEVRHGKDRLCYHIVHPFDSAELNRHRVHRHSGLDCVAKSHMYNIVKQGLSKK